jgi:CheY-like chemotaxis protein
MTTSIVICDDSSMARKQMARSLPENWNVEVTFASDGYEGLRAINDTRAEIMFLDLNMPEMDGYEVLRAIREMDLPTMVIVVSGDIQPEAYQRVVKLGALDFIKKPVAPGDIEKVLKKYGIPVERKSIATKIDVKVSFTDGYQEIANVAMGRAADLLARLLHVFVILPVPNVSMLEASELRMALNQISDTDTSVSALCQGFIGPGIAGEALLIFNETSFTDIAELMNFKGEINEAIHSYWRFFKRHSRSA